jgi:SAM-dependent methyltransferase
MGDRVTERVLSDDASPWFMEHAARYRLAAGYVAGRSVLDVACGTGFGAARLMDAGATRVIGLDIAWDALTTASRLGLRDVGLCRADALSLPVADESVDVVTSFETIEHLRDGQAFIAEVRRVVNQTHGIVILSTPNAYATQPVDNVPKNPYHVREYYPEELTSLLAEHFPSVELKGQVVSRDYGYCPYWVTPASPASTVRQRLSGIGWKLERRLLPDSWKDSVSRLIHRRAFYPSDTDFVFDSSAVEVGHVTVAICKMQG